MIHEKLKAAREKKGYTQKQVCAILNLRTATLSEFENGIRGLSSKTVNELINLYNLEITNDMSNVNAINDIFGKIDELFTLKTNYPNRI